MATIKVLYVFILITMTLMGAVASLFLKKASGFKNIKEIIFNVNLYIGGILYVIAALLNVYILKFLDYSTVLPLTSITYIWTMLLSYFILKEKVGAKKIIGVCGILLGVFLIAM